MRNKWLCSLALLLGTLVWRAAAQTADEIINLAQKGVAEEVILATVEHSKTSYNLTAADILKLKDAKVPDKVIAAMIRHKGEGGDAAVALPREPAPPLPAAPVAKIKEVPAEGILNIENVDDKIWSYSYEPETRTLWISTPAADGRGNLAANGGLTVRMPAGAYKVRYNGQDKGPSVTVFTGEKSLLLLSRVDTAELEALYVSVFERGERKSGGRIAVLRESPAPRSTKNKSTDNDSPPQERVVEVPSTTVIYRDAPVIYSPPIYYGPRYYAPVYPYGYHSGYFNYSHYGHHSGISIGLGF